MARLELPSADNPKVDTSPFDDAISSPEGSARPVLNPAAVAHFVEQEASTYFEAGEFYFRNPVDLGMRVLVNWFNDVSMSSLERRRGTLEMLAMYGLSAAESIGGMEFAGREYDALISSVSDDKVFGEHRSDAVHDVVVLLESGADATAELPAKWDTYTDAHPVLYTTACLVFALLTLETVRQAALDDDEDPADMWVEWLRSSSTQD